MLQHVGRVVLRDSEGDQHVFSSTPGTCLCDGQPGSHATLAIPDLDMVDTRPPDTQQEEEEEEAPPLVLPFSHPRCDDPSITGGKGASLGGIHLYFMQTLHFQLSTFYFMVRKTVKT